MYNWTLMRNNYKIIEILLVIAYSLLQTLSNIFRELSWILMTYSTCLFAFSMIYISQIVQSSSFTKLCIKK